MAKGIRLADICSSFVYYRNFRAEDKGPCYICGHGFWVLRYNVPGHLYRLYQSHSEYMRRYHEKDLPQSDP